MSDLWNDVANVIENKRNGRDAKDRPWSSWEIADDIRELIQTRLEL